jgi:mono/diheme cytochrome c family protein
MKNNKYLLLISSLGVLALLVAAAVDENILRDWRRIQSAGRNDEGAIPVQLRQVVNPQLRVSDRCVSCHVSMGPGEQAVTGGDLLKPHRPVVHDPAEYGCTVCHGGQGLATEKADAHGDVHFWPSPMLPVKYLQAGCGTCHSTLGVPERDGYRAARGAFERLDCTACHRVDGRGGTIRPDGGGMEGSELSRVGIAGYDAGWYEKHLKKSGEAAGGAWKVSFAPISDADRELVAKYLALCVAAPKLVEAKSAFHSSGCLGCHKVSGVGGDEGPDLTRAGEKDPGQMSFSAVSDKPTVSNWLAEHFQSPGSIVAGSQMPPVEMTGRDVEMLTLYVLSLRRRDVPGSYTPRDRLRAMRMGEREFANDGATLFGAFCAGCHGMEGKGRHAPGMAAFPAIASADFQSLVSDEFLRETIRKGRPGRRMPGWDKDGGLKPAEIDSVIAHLRRLAAIEKTPADAEPSRVSADIRAGEQRYTASCSGCHGKKGEGGEGPALHNPVLLSKATDGYLVETIARGRKGTAMHGFGEPSTVHRTYSRPEIETIAAFIRTWEGKK